jgi:predicted DNA-binding transcriptional regulator AlpA
LSYDIFFNNSWYPAGTGPAISPHATPFGDMWETDVDDDLNSIRVLSEPETYRAVGLSDRTWERLKAIGDTPPKTRLSEGRIGYRLSDIKKWLDARREGEGESWKKLGDAASRVVESCGADIRDHQHKMQAELNRRREKP